MKNTLVFSDKSKSEVIGIISCYRDGDDIMFDVYTKKENGLMLVNQIGNHIYAPTAQKETISQFINDYKKEYFDGCYCEER